MTNETPRIYAASLSDYNAGRLHGVWIDCDNGPEAIWDAINAMLAASPEFRAFPQGGPAEEWAIHDYEGFGVRLSESESIERVARLGAAIAEADDPDALRAFLAWDEGDDDENMLERFAECYRGKWDSMRDYVQNETSELGFRGLTPEQLDEVSGFIDWDHVANEYLVAYGYSTVPAQPYGVYVFQGEA